MPGLKEVIHDSGQPFAIVRAVPTAALNRSRYLLLVFSDNRTPEERANEAAQAQEAEDKQNGKPQAHGRDHPDLVRQRQGPERQRLRGLRRRYKIN